MMQGWVTSTLMGWYRFESYCRHFCDDIAQLVRAAKFPAPIILFRIIQEANHVAMV